VKRSFIRLNSVATNIAFAKRNAIAATPKNINSFDEKFTR